MPVQPRVFLDFEVAGKPAGRVIFELFSNTVPKTAENFRALCTGEKGVSPISHVPLHYKGSIVHRVIDGFMIQGGDFVKRNGAGGESIYGGKFPDEKLEGPGSEVDREGLLVMANRGPNTNGSQFFVTLAPSPHLTGKHVVFGRVVSGFEHIAAIGKLPVDDKDKPLSGVTVAHCGELELRRSAASKPRSPSPRSSKKSSERRGRSRSRDRGRRQARSSSPSRSPSRSRSESAKKLSRRYDSSDSEEEREERKRRKERKREKKEKRRSKRAVEETIEELDARLEREEKEQLERERLEKEAEEKKRIEEERRRARETGGVVYKGRGSMRYLDPENAAERRHQPNYSSRGPDVRPRRFGPRGDSDRWQRGVDAPPHFDRQRNDKDLDRYSHRGGNRDDRDDRDGRNGELDEGRERRKRDWDDWRVGRTAAPQFERGRERSLEQNASPPPPVVNRSPSPAIRAESPPRGDRSDAGSDMVIDADDD